MAVEVAVAAELAVGGLAGAVERFDGSFERGQRRPRFEGEVVQEGLALLDVPGEQGRPVAVGGGTSRVKGPARGGQVAEQAVGAVDDE